MTEVGGSAEVLSVLHQRLETHFMALRTNRDRTAGPGFPIFALEHGLTDAELTLLTTTVRAAVQRRHLPGTPWLPFIIYAAEIGYEYSGVEYWQTFTARTPGWAEFGDREYIRSNFYKFAKQFGGARHCGACGDCGAGFAGSDAAPRGWVSVAVAVPIGSFGGPPLRSDWEDGKGARHI